MIAQALLQDWLYDQLDADVTLATVVGERISNGYPDKMEARPFVVFRAQESTAVTGVGRTHVWDTTFEVVANATGNAVKSLQTAADRFDVLLDNIKVSTAALAMRWE